MKFIPVYVIPHDKSQTTDDDQAHDHQIHQPVVIVTNQGIIRHFIAHQVKACITKGRNRMEKAVKHPTEKAIFRHETDR